MRTRNLISVAAAGVLLALLVFLATDRSTEVAEPAPAPRVAPTASNAPSSPAPTPRQAQDGCMLELTITGTDDPVPVLVVQEENYEILATWRVDSDKGQARLEGLEPGHYRATADSPDHVPASMKALKCTGNEHLTATLHLQAADAWFTGQVFDAEGRPLDAEVSIVEAGQTGVFPGPASIDTDDGTYRLGVVAGTHYNLYANAEGYRFSGSMTQSPQAGDEILVDFTLKLEGLVRGTVLGPDGDPLVGAVVQRLPVSTKRATTNADGHYALASHPGQRHVLSAHHGDLYGWVEVGTIEEGEDRFDVDIPMRPGRTVLGQVVHADTGEPVGPTTVVWSAAGTGLLKKVPVAADGTFVATGVPYDWPMQRGVFDPAVPSDHIGFFLHDTHMPAELIKVALPPQETTIEVPFRPRG